MHGPPPISPLSIKAKHELHMKAIVLMLFHFRGSNFRHFKTECFRMYVLVIVTGSGGANCEKLLSFYAAT